MNCKYTLILVSLVIVFSSAGCAGYIIEKNGTGTGYDFYRPEPYLLVRQNSSAKSAAEIVWLPNYNHRYRVRTWNYLAKADIKFTFEEGWCLESISDKSDNTELISKVLDGIRKVTSPATLSALSGDVLLFRIVFDEETGAFIGLKHVPVLEAGGDQISSSRPMSEKQECAGTQ